MRYTGEYQIQQSRQDEKTVTVSLPGSFGAFPGDRAELRLSKLGLEGFFSRGREAGKPFFRPGGGCDDMDAEGV